MNSKFIGYLLAVPLILFWAALPSYLLISSFIERVDIQVFYVLAGAFFIGWLLSWVKLLRIPTPEKKLVPLSNGWIVGATFLLILFSGAASSLGGLGEQLELLTGLVFYILIATTSFRLITTKPVGDPGEYIEPIKPLKEILQLALVSLTVVGVIAFLAYTSPNSDPKPSETRDNPGSQSLREQLEETSDSLNESLPTMLDAETQLFMSFVSDDMKFHYEYILVDRNARDVDFAEIENFIGETLQTQYCYHSDFTFYRENDVSMVWNYYDKNKVKIGSIEKNPSGCSERNTGTRDHSAPSSFLSVGEGEVVVNNQRAGVSVELESATYPISEGWIGVREYNNNELGLILGLVRFSESQNLIPSKITLQIETEPGKQYAIVLFTENGDLDFSLESDVQINMIYDTFTAL